MKKLINDPANAVAEMVAGLVASQPGLTRIVGRNVVLRADLPAPEHRKVAIISGGGSGHEPAHAGYVGAGMLTAAVLGDVFTSPSVDAVLEAIQATAGPAGALLIVKNYTGDRLNFGLAAEIARAGGIPAEIVVVGDDAALEGIVARERRRGIAGTVLVHKVAGAAAEQGRELAVVAQLAARAADAVRSMGVALGSCTLPSAKAPSFTLGDEEIEFGLGIHGEMGARRSAMLPANRIVSDMLDRLVEDLGERAREPIGLVVNGLGATTQLELMIVAGNALDDLSRRGVNVARVWVGNFMTALEMPGCSLSLMPLDDELSALIDQETAAPAWPGPGVITQKTAVDAPAAADDILAGEVDGPVSGAVRNAMLAIAEALDAAEQKLTELDSVAGDGDLGASMVRGAVALRSVAARQFSTPSKAFDALALALRREIAGSSGPFYAIALMRVARLLEGEAAPSADLWGKALAEAAEAVSATGGAKPGDRTMLDALSGAIEGWRAARGEDRNGLEAFDAAAAGAAQGARKTAEMTPKLGRASYLGERVLGHADAGATAVAIWMDAIARSLRA
ncbi:dihydroxyacetone kinase family protein [Stappia indica]|uniref:Dihydroxyacetone kinase subunit DhaK n=1 Tax=Stappia indica TaxID=538381 RepID=A0A857C728_9HYPH|nr:dihydroxyacetone kinase family protein [Stappia indica]QGZ34679.1 dihydroxyacetone kinase subunit DhaK [Stappia indica]